MCLVLGLNVFTACYGPAPYIEDQDSESTEQTDGTKAAADEEASEEEAAEAQENA